MVGIGVSVAAVVLLLPAPFVQRRPIWLPLIALYGAQLVDLMILLWGCRRYALPHLRRGYAPGSTGTEQHVAQPLSKLYLIRFFWPLALIMAIQGMSRPAVNLFISRGPQGEEALAVLAQQWSGPTMAYPDSVNEDADNVQLDHVIDETSFVDYCVQWHASGVRILGGCCGLTLSHIVALTERLGALTRNDTAVAVKQAISN